MNKLPLLLKREYWEHRGGFLWTPVWITASILILTVLGIISAEVFRSSHAHVQIGFSLDELRRSISADDIAKAANGLDIVQMVFVGMASVGLFFVTFFYLLGALYDDRRDRSVLFWKSLPVSDTETVLSKAVTAMLVMPAIMLAVATLAYLAFLIVVSVWLGLHGLNPLPALWDSHPIGMLLRLIAILPVQALWALPAVGWLLFWSAYVRSKPFLWAVLIPVVALIANAWLGLLGAPHVSGDLHLASVLGRLLFSVMPGSWVGADGISVGDEHVTFHLQDDHVLSSLDPGNVYGLLATPNLWIGAIGGLVLLICAVRLRQRRVETSV